jgi:hypothetical protein
MFGFVGMGSLDTSMLEDLQLHSGS